MCPLSTSNGASPKCSGETAEEKETESKEICVFAPECEDHCRIRGWRSGHHSRYQASVLHVSLDGSVNEWQEEAQASGEPMSFECSPWSTLGLSSWGFCYFWRGGLSRCSEHHLFTLLVREGSHSLEVQYDWTHTPDLGQMWEKAIYSSHILPPRGRYCTHTGTAWGIRSDWVNTQ